jgi:hypothetical protein
MKSSILTFFLSLTLGATLAHGATVMVTPGEDLQTALNSANQNDHIKILPGTFSGQYILADKNLTISKSGGTPNLTKLSLDGGTVTLIGLQIGQLLSSDSSEQNGNHLVHQCEIGNIESNTSAITVQYSDVGSMVINKNGTVTGCTFDGAGGGGVGITVSGAGSDAIIQNSIIRNYSLSTASPIIDSCIGVLVSDSTTATIQNNIIHSCNDRNFEGTEVNSGIGIFVRDESSAKISANILWDCFISYRTNNSGVVTGDTLAHLSDTTSGSHNVLWSLVDSRPSKMNSNVWNINNLTKGSGSLSNSIFSDPKFVNWENGNYQLQSNSPCINAGPPDPQYNDRDGSRNDIGMFGGHNFIPDGRTTNKPIVLGLDIAPIAVPTGGTVTIESTGATVK